MIYTAAALKPLWLIRDRNHYHVAVQHCGETGGQRRYYRESISDAVRRPSSTRSFPEKGGETDGRTWCVPRYIMQSFASVRKPEWAVHPIITDNKGMKFYPVFTDHIELVNLMKQKIPDRICEVPRSEKLVRKVDGIVVNPFGFDSGWTEKRLTISRKNALH